jgi:hypothetical protein
MINFVEVLQQSLKEVVNKDNGTLSNALNQCMVKRLESLQLKQHISQSKDLRHTLELLDHPLQPVELKVVTMLSPTLKVALKMVLLDNQLTMVTTLTQPQMPLVEDLNSPTPILELANGGKFNSTKNIGLIE